MSRGHRAAVPWSGAGDVGAIFALSYFPPVAVLAVGIPIALAVRLLAWAAGAL